MEQFIYSPKARWLIFFFFLIPALVFPLQGAYKGIVQHSCDLQHDWVAGKMVHRGVNPYRVWVDTPERVLDYFPESDCPVPLPEIAFLNTPLTAFLMVPLQSVDWDPLHITWVAMQFILIPLTVLVLMRLIHQPPRDRYIELLLVVILFGWFGTRLIIVYGQLSMLITLLTFGSLAMLYRGRDIPAGILLGIALCKFTMIWALPLLFLAYRRFKALAIAIALQLLGVVLMAIATRESLIEILRSYVDAMTAWTGQTDGVVSLSRWVSEVGIISESFTLVPGVILSLWVTFGLYRHITLSPERDLSTVPQRLEATLFAAILILISLTFVYHRYYDMALTLIVVVFWFNLTELPERTEAQERAKNILAIAVGLLLFINLLPPNVMDRIAGDLGVLVLEALYTTGLVIVLGIVLWVAAKLSRELDSEQDDYTTSNAKNNSPAPIS